MRIYPDGIIRHLAKHFLATYRLVKRSLGKIKTTRANREPTANAELQQVDACDVFTL